MNSAIVVLSAAAVFFYLLRALPDSALNGSRPWRSAASEGRTQRSKLSTRLSRAAAATISFGLLIVLIAMIVYDRQLTPLVTFIMVATSLWAAVDSQQVGLRYYNTRIALHPILLFNLMYLLSPVLFPWYMIVCSKIGDGTLERKP